VLGIHSNATDGCDHGIALSPGSGRVRKLCLLPHHRVLRLELVLFVPGRVFVVCLCILAMYRPVFARHLRKENDIHERIYTHVIDTEETYWRMACVVEPVSRPFPADGSKPDFRNKEIRDMISDTKDTFGELAFTTKHIENNLLPNAYN